MTVKYEWDVELLTAFESDAHEQDEVIDHNFCETYAEAKTLASKNPGEGFKFEIVLVRDDDDRRSWAYLDNGKLPEFAEDAYGCNWGKIPKRFHSEVAKA